jgi:hypothetical protein
MRRSFVNTIGRHLWNHRRRVGWMMNKHAANSETSIISSCIDNGYHLLPQKASTVEHESLTSQALTHYSATQPRPGTMWVRLLAL